MAKKIAVLLSSYNGEKYIRQQIDSILTQRLTDIELFLYVRDDGSSDSTKEIISDYEAKNPNVKIFCEENKGYVYGFLRLLQIANESEEKFDYVSFSDQDDVWDDDKLQTAINKLNEENSETPCLYQSITRLVDGDLNFIKFATVPEKEICVMNTIIQIVSPGHTYVMNRRCMEMFSRIYDVERIYSHDSFVTNMVAIRGKILFDKTPHNSYRQHGDNVLGTSHSSASSWIKKRMKRVRNGELKQYARQIEYLYEINENLFDERSGKEICKFLKARKNFFTRLHYILHTKLYRQKFVENCVFKMAYLFRGYNT